MIMKGNQSYPKPVRLKRSQISKGYYLAVAVFLTGTLSGAPCLSESVSEKGDDASRSALPDNQRLKGTVTQSSKPSPLLYGSVQAVPPGTSVNLIISGNLNSEISQKGDEVLARVACDVAGRGKVFLPGGWYMHGLVTNVATQKRGGRDGYVEVEFDKLVSPEGDIELPFKAKVSTKDNELKAIAKTALIDSGYISYGALGGSILSVQLTGIPVAIATHGISVGIGAAAGGMLGAIGAVKRKGNIRSFFPGDELKLVTAEPITLPGFDPTLIPSAIVPKTTPDLTISVEKVAFHKDPLGDKLSRLLTLDATIDNETSKEYSFFDLAILSDHNMRYYPLPAYVQIGRRKVAPHSKATAQLSFNVDSAKHKYWLLLLDKVKREEIGRANVN
jgi:hypothetical protein